MSLIGIGAGIPFVRGGGLVRAIQALFAASEKGVWYDPSDLTTLYKDSAGTTPVTAVGQEVGLMLDKSGNGFHATQSTTAAKPILQQDAGGHYYLLFDGLDDFMVTSSIDFSGTDKMSVFAGVRKLSDAAIGAVVELGGGSVDGAFSMLAPQAIATANYRFSSRGIGLGGSVSAVAPSNYAAPITSVLTGIANLSGDRTSIRVNGTEVDANTADHGTGNFLNAAINIGMRTGTLLPFNGHLYSLIVRGALSDAAQISAAESYVNSKTGAF